MVQKSKIYHRYAYKVTDTLFLVLIQFILIFVFTIWGTAFIQNQWQNCYYHYHRCQWLILHLCFLHLKMFLNETLSPVEALNNHLIPEYWLDYFFFEWADDHAFSLYKSFPMHYQSTLLSVLFYQKQWAYHRHSQSSMFSSNCLPNSGGKFTTIVFLLCNGLLTWSVFCALWTSVINIFLVYTFAGGLVKMLPHSSRVHSFINCSSHRVFFWK